MGGGAKGEAPLFDSDHRRHLGERAINNALYNPTYEGDTNAPKNYLHDRALNGIVNTAATSTNVDQAAALNQQTMEGKFLGPNPNLKAALAPIREEFMRTVSPGIDAAAAGAGRLGSGAHAVQRDTAEQQLSDSMSRVAYNDYAQERGYQNQAMAQAPALSQARYADDQQVLGAANIYRGFQQNHYDDAARRFYERNEAPERLLGIAAGTQVQSRAPNKAGGALGGAMTGAGTGAMIGGPWGAAVGGVIGGLGGYLSS